MPHPSSTLATLRPDLASSLEAFDLEADRRKFIGQRVLRPIDVAVQAGVFGKIPIEQLLQKRETKRAPGAAYSRGDWKFTSDSFACEEHGDEEPVDDREAAMYASYFEAEQFAAQLGRDIVLRNREIEIAAAIFNPTTFASYTTGVTTEWSTAATCVPITDVKTAKQAVWSQCGLWPNAAIMNQKVFENLRHCAQVIDRLAGQGAGSSVRPADIGTAQIAALFDLPYILVAGGAKNTADEGQDASLDWVWDDEYCMIARIAETVNPKEPCLGRIFHFTPDGSSVEGTVESYRDETHRADIIRVRNDMDVKIIMAQCGHLLSNITA